MSSAPHRVACAGMKQSAQHLGPDRVPSLAPSQQLSGEATAADVFAAVHQPPLQIAEGASQEIRNCITASIALAPDLSLSGMKSLSIRRPGGWVPELADKVAVGEASAAIRIDEEEGEATEEPETVVEGVEQALQPGSVFDLPGGAPVMQALTDAWGAMRSVFPGAFLLDGSPVAFIDAPSSDTQLWIHRNRKLKQVRMPLGFA